MKPKFKMVTDRRSQREVQLKVGRSQNPVYEKDASQYQTVQTEEAVINSAQLAKDPLMIDLRKSIDNLDTSFIKLLTERMRVVGKIIYLKKSYKIDLNRSEARIEDMRQLIELSVELKLESIFFQKILDLVFQDALVRFGDQTNDTSMESIGSGWDLDALRLTLLNLDKSLCLVLAERFKVVKRIGTYKHKLGIPPLDKTRWQHILDHKVATAESMDVSPPLIKDVFTAIHEVALNIEDQMIG